MHPLLAASWIGLGTVITTAFAGMAQRTTLPRRAAAVSAVIEYRKRWLKDSTQFDACRVYVTLDRTRRFKDLIPVAFHGMLDQINEPCDSTLARSRREAWDLVFLDSLVVQDTTARAFLRVRRGEYLHNEEYTIREWDTKEGWGVTTVLLSGALRITRGPRP